MRVTENKKHHNTDKYEMSSLIVRRNKEFTIVIKFNRALKEQEDNVQLEFLIGEHLHPLIDLNTWSICNEEAVH